METIIQISSLSKQFKNGRGIKNIHVEIYQGEIFGFLGPNGAGKTTVMKLMTGLMQPDAGDVKLFGYNVSDQYEKAMQNVGCIIESVESYDYLTALQNLRQIGRYYKVDKKRIDEVLELVGLQPYKNEKVNRFSLGMKQRLGIAGALLAKPKLVILDEPFNGLDVEGMVEIRNLILHMAEIEKTTFFISSHLIHDIERTCNRVAIIHKGNLLGVESVEKILQNHASLEQYFVSEVEKYGSI